MAHSDAAPSIAPPLAQSELRDADALVREAGWNQLAADWQIFLDLGAVHAVRDGARVIATAATLPFGGRFAWISMVLVAGEYRRRGLATRLLRRCIDDLLANGLVPILDATPAGRPLYASLGFADSWSYQRFAARETGGAAKPPALPPGVTIRAIADADRPAICAYDAPIFGADRSPMLTRLLGRLPGAELLAERNGRVVGCLLGRDGRSASQLGPLIAEDDAIALALLAHGLAATRGPIYVDLADAKSDIRQWLEQRGFAAQRPLTRMLYGRRERFDDARRTFAVTGPEFG